MIEINILTLYAILGVGCALASWAEDFQRPDETPLNFWEYVFIVALGPVFAVFELVILVRNRLRK